jgi:hypothetical protein
MAPGIRRSDRSWAFRGGGPVRTREERERLADRLPAALRVAAGWPVDLTLRWTTGPAAAVRIGANDERTARWVAGAFLSSYPTGAWVGASGEVPATPTTVAVGRAIAGPNRPFRVLAGSTAPWSDSVVAALSLLPEGSSVEWRLRPLGYSATHPPAAKLVSQPLGFRSDLPTTAYRRLADQVADRTVAPTWDVRVTLLGRDRAAAEPLARLVESAAREDGGNGMAWSWTGRWFGRTPPGIALALPEILPLFPSPSLRMPNPPMRGTSAAWTIPVGRSAAGELWSLQVEPDQGRHALLLGETGMGKSSLLLRAAIRASEFGSVVFFDPIGDTSRRLLDRLPPASLRRVVWVSPGLSPVAVNALAPVSLPPPVGDRALGDLVALLRRVRAGRYADSPFWGPRLEEMLSLSLRAAAAYPHGTLRDASEILAAAGGRIVGVPPEAEDRVRELVDRVRSRPEEVDGARRVLDEVVRSPVLARMLAAPEARFSLGEAVRTGRIVLVTGDATEVGESVARVLLSVHLALLWGEILASRSRTKTFVIADEIQWYANDAVAELFRLGRRFNVHLWAATQSLASLPDSTREASLTNAADIIAFRGSPDDAKELARWTADLTIESVLALRRGEAVVLLGKGRDVGWVRLPFDPDHPRPDRWSRVWEQCRDLWAPPDAGDRAPGQEAETKPAASTVSDEVRTVLLVLWAGLLADGAADSVTVALDPLRTEAGVDPAAVRQAGQRISAVGALDASDGPDGRTWTVRRERFAELLGPGVAPAELERADAQWARLSQLSRDAQSRKGL